MVGVIISGVGGAMGQALSARAKARPDCNVVAGIDPNFTGEDFPVFGSPADCNVAADVIVDFSHPSALEGLLEFADNRGLPLVVATTGLSESQVESVRQAARSVPIFFSFNMSLGVNLMSALAGVATKVLGGQFDIEIIERHHNRKLDAPSGTAIMLANAVSKQLPIPPDFVYERHSRREQRASGEIGIHAIRGGTIVGEHELLFAGQDETLSITHTAYSRDVFATGALAAAVFMFGKPPGLYDMNDLIAAGKT